MRELAAFVMQMIEQNPNGQWQAATRTVLAEIRRRMNGAKLPEPIEFSRTKRPGDWEPQVDPGPDAAFSGMSRSAAMALQEGGSCPCCLRPLGWPEAPKEGLGWPAPEGPSQAQEGGLPSLQGVQEKPEEPQAPPTSTDEGDFF